MVCVLSGTVVRCLTRYVGSDAREVQDIITIGAMSGTRRIIRHNEKCAYCNDRRDLTFRRHDHFPLIHLFANWITHSRPRLQRGDHPPPVPSRLPWSRIEGHSGCGPKAAVALLFKRLDELIASPMSCPREGAESYIFGRPATFIAVSATIGSLSRAGAPNCLISARLGARHAQRAQGKRRSSWITASQD
jgi:hypothetical protein